MTFKVVRERESGMPTGKRLNEPTREKDDAQKGVDTRPAVGVDYGPPRQQERVKP